MQQSTNYNFNLPEGTDLVNLLTQLIPNWSSLDSILRGIQNDTFETATETVALGVHALARLDPDAKLLKWVATANYTSGETFTIDGTPIAASTPSGNTLATGAYVSGAIVIAAINSDETAMTVFVTGTNVASDSERLGGELPSYYATDQDMETAKQNIEDLDNLMGNTSISAIGDGTVTGAISSLSSDLADLESKVDNMQMILDFDNAVTLSVGNYTTTSNGAIVGGGRGGSSYVLITADGKAVGGIGTSSMANASVFVAGIPSGTVINLSAAMSVGAIQFVPYKTT